jgi:hypothetical protein
MTVRVWENVHEEGTEEVNASTVEVPHTVDGTEDTAEMIAALETFVPYVRDGKVFKNYRYHYAGGGVWEVQVRYGPAPEVTFSWDTTGGTQHITQSLETIGRFRSTDPPLPEQATATSTILADAVDSVVIQDGGSGYTSPPDVTFTGGGGSGAEGTAVLSGDAVISVTIDDGGSGYTSAPDVTFTGGGGIASGTAALDGDAVGTVTVDDGGANYVTAPLVEFSGAGGLGATAIATVSGGAVTGVTVTNGGSGYNASVEVRFVGGAAVDATGAPSFNGAIGVHEGQVEGCDITIAVFNFTIERNVAADDLPEDYAVKVYQLTGTTNDAPFAVTYKGQLLVFDTGECLFLGGTGQIKGQSNWQVNLKFSGSPSRDDLVIGDIGPVAKEGWHYLWTLYEDATDGGASVKRPKAVYVEKVYRDGDFLDLGLEAP